MSKLVVLALDIAKHRTGWALGSPDMERPWWGTYCLAGEWDRHEGQRLHQWREFLEKQIHDAVEKLGGPVTYIAMERAFINTDDFNWNGTVPQLQMIGIVNELAFSRGIRTGEVSIGSWRAHFLGTSQAPKGTAKEKRTPVLKDMAMRRCANRGWYCTLHDEAEALGIMDFALACLDRDYEHKTGPDVRRAELKAEQAAFRGEAPL